MSKAIGEAHLDPTSKKYFYEIKTDSGELLLRSDPEFATQGAAEAELIELLKGLGKKVKP